MEHNFNISIELFPHEAANKPDTCVRRLLQLLVTAVLVEPAPGAGLHAAFLEGDRYSGQRSLRSPAFSARKNPAKTIVGAITQIILKSIFSFCSEGSDCQNTLYFPPDTSAA